MRRVRGVFLHLLVVVLVFAAAVPAATAQQALSDEIVAQLSAAFREKASWTETQRKMDSNLIIESKKRLGRSMAPGYPELRTNLQRDSEDRVLVDIKATVSQDLLDLIVAAGGEIIASVPRFDAIRAALPGEYLETVAAHSDVRTIKEAAPFKTNKINTTEGDGAHRADEARADFGVDGTGVNIGVLSDSVDSLASLQTSGDLPPTVTVLPNQSGNPASSEGTAMLEIVFDLAPGASLFYATAIPSPATFAQNILNLRAAGCHVIVDDIGYAGEPAFQDGVIAQAVETVVANGASYFSAAGNSGNLNDGTAGVFEGDFFGLEVTVPDVGTIEVHDFGFGNPFNQLTIDSPFVFELHWADPLGGSANDYDLALINAAQTEIVFMSNNPQTGFQDPIELISSIGFNDAGSFLVVAKISGDDRFFHLNSGGGVLQFATDGQMTGHAAAESAFGVAAVDITDAPNSDGSPFTGSEEVELFSSDGPRRVFFEADGTPYTPGDFSSTGGVVRNKPDFAAADGVMTATPGFNPFFGTSAAAPHAAALAALLIDAGTFTTPDQVRQALGATAIDIEAPGMDRDSGYGIIDINAALNINCDYDLTPPSRLVPSGGVVDATIDIVADSGCPWTVTTNSPFITLTSETSGSGNGQVTYSVAVNNGLDRFGTIDISGTVHTVTQEACQIPIAAMNPTAQSGCVGGSATFVAAGTGSPPLGIQWQVNEGIGFKNIANATGQYLVVNDITPAMDGYQYHAVFFNSCGNMATAPAQLVVGAPDAPTGVTATNGAFTDRVRINWNAVPGASGYRVFRSQSSNGSGAVDISGLLTGLTFDDMTAATEMTTGCNPTEVAIVYRYFVVAANQCGDSTQSNAASGAIGLSSKRSASLTPDTWGDVAVLLLTLAALYGWQRRRTFAQTH